jgi:glucose/arabinose dehydrogenase
MLHPVIRTAFCGSLFVAAFVFAAEPQRYPSEQGQVLVKPIVEGLENPWALAFLPDGKRMLVTERPGHLRLVGLDGSLSEPLGGVPEVFARAQGGLLDVQLSPDFATDRMVYLSYAEAGEQGMAGTAVGRGRLSEDLARLEDFEVIFRQQPKLSNGIHFGSRLVFDREGYLFIALGENNQRPTAQDLGKLQGKVVRLRPDGTVPRDNPFVGQQGARPEIWSYGHRNQQGAALNPWSGVLWTHEHGPRGGDEINRPEAGKNYGWPVISDGMDYLTNLPYAETRGTAAPGMERPYHVWAKSPALSGMAFLVGHPDSAWNNSLLLGALAGQRLIRLSLDGERIVGEERLLGELHSRIRDVRVGPDGAVYVLTDETDGQLLRLVPPAAAKR